MGDKNLNFWNAKVNLKKKKSSRIILISHLILALITALYVFIPFVKDINILVGLLGFNSVYIFITVSFIVFDRDNWE